MSSELVKPTAVQQIEMLKELTRTTGALHEAQVLNLKLWPLCVFDMASTSEFTWDPELKSVTFTMSMPKKAKTPKLSVLKERVTILNKWVQALLGDEWMIHVKLAGKTYNGSRKINVNRADPNAPKTDAGAKGSPPDAA